MTIDKRAANILMNTYWSSEGWRDEPIVSPEDLAYAKAHHVMFDPVRFSHDEAINAAFRSIAAIAQAEVVSAFIASLSLRRLDLRSGLGSYAIGRHLQRHRAKAGFFKKLCPYCGLYPVEDVDLNILSFERLKWGGVRHTDPTYIAFDLRMLRETQRPPPSPDDFRILDAILSVARSMPSNARLSDLDKSLSKVLASNSAERRILIGILGYAGILIDPSRPAFRRGFVAAAEREETPWHKDDWPYPVQWWKGSFGIDEAAVEDWFPYPSVESCIQA